MEKNLYIDASHPNETRVVLKSNGNIEDYEYESLDSTLIKNNIYLGKVSRVEPSLQAAFIDFGRERHGFLSFNDIQSDYYQIPQNDLDKIKQEEEKVREELIKESEKEEEKNIIENKVDINDPVEKKVDQVPETEKIAVEKKYPFKRYKIQDKKKPILMDYINPKKVTYLPNTAGCFTSSDALRTLRLAREIGGWKLVKLEVLGDKKTLFPDMIETLKSTEVLSKEGFKVMVYCNDDPLMAKRLENVGAAAIMPLAAPIGSGLGILNQTNIKIIRSQTKLPLIIDAGLGQSSDSAIAMELGCDGVLINTAIASAKNPFKMAEAMKLSVIAGRYSYLAGRIKKTTFGIRSTTNKGII